MRILESLVNQIWDDTKHKVDIKILYPFFTPALWFLLLVVFLWV